ncbi:hypothetical protein OG488_38565 [Streptomyces sp. NBC_01460]|uniref:hypothetical protein n=1 Tax=Streptomyces sp. NBC_01460 TaxID=2903875 RepID=UPI002E32A676|nr:hypothetical protein [Streptomyces sp. NBC_01460]
MLGLLATIRERQGHIDEAIALLRRRQITSVNSRDQLDDPLARHGRIEELQAYAALDSHEEAVQQLAEAGRLHEADTVLQQRLDHKNSHDLAGSLIDLGRVEEALSTLPTAPATAHANNTPVVRQATVLKPSPRTGDDSPSSAGRGGGHAVDGSPRLGTQERGVPPRKSPAGANLRQPPARPVQSTYEGPRTRPASTMPSGHHIKAWRSPGPTRTRRPPSTDHKGQSWTAALAALGLEWAA